MMIILYFTVLVHMKGSTIPDGRRSEIHVSPRSFFLALFAFLIVIVFSFSFPYRNDDEPCRHRGE